MVAVGLGALAAVAGWTGVVGEWDHVVIIVFSPFLSDVYTWYAPSE